MWAAAALSAGLLELPFPMAGPLPPWRTIFAFFGLVPLFWALLKTSQPWQRRPLRQSFLVAYFFGFLWYLGNCYWIRDTMSHYGGMPPLAPTLLLIGFSLVLGLYCGLFGLGFALIRQGTGSDWSALALAPVVWTALDLAAARITSVPWDQLGYSQVDNALLTHFAPWTGVYGITYILVASNGVIAGGFTQNRRQNIYLWILDVLMLGVGGAGGMLQTTLRPEPVATAVLIQPNLDVGNENNWRGADWDRHIADFMRLAGENCKSYIEGIPQTDAETVEPDCPPSSAHPDLVVWPESPAPFIEGDPNLQQALRSVVRAAQAPLVVGGIGVDESAGQQGANYYNSAFIVNAAGQSVGRYDKIHLVPFGEYIPFQNLLTFARKLTGRVSSFTRGTERNSFPLATQDHGEHRYGVFICYEAVFADEVRRFAKNGAEVFVNVSDDGWYGDTSAPWQHLNMARMRAIENRRWLLRDTNSGVTAAIDPYGRVRQSIPRHQTGALTAGFGFNSERTFYTMHGDVFAWLCAILSIGVVGWSMAKSKTR